MAGSPAVDRLTAIDLARGAAMLGVALVNVHAFAATWGSVYGLDLARTAWDVFAEYAIAISCTHRSYPVLAFLFGAGLALQWQRLPEHDRVPQRLHARLWALLAIGVGHGLMLWPGDILAAYAVVGLIVVSALRVSTRSLLWWVGSLYGMLLLGYIALGVGLMASGDAVDAVRDSPASFAASSFAEAFRRRQSEFLERGLAQLAVPDIWLHVLLGLWAGQTGALQRFIAYPRAGRWPLIASIVLFAAGTAIEIVGAQYGGWSSAKIDGFGEGLMAIGVLPASVGAIGCLLAVAAFWADRQGRVASFVVAAGRTPLTQFIGQSVIFALLFNHSMIGWYGELGRAAMSLIAIATYVLLCGFSRAWLVSGHVHGPMEMLWRRLTSAFSPPRTRQTATESPPS